MTENEIIPPPGKTKDVMIRGMPEALWERIGAAARRNNLTNAEFLVEHFRQHSVDMGLAIAAAKPAQLTHDKQPLSTLDIRALSEVSRSLKEMDALEPQTTRALNLLIRRLSRTAASG